jgi:hypothetical protein
MVRGRQLKVNSSVERVVWGYRARTRRKNGGRIVAEDDAVRID